MVQIADDEADDEELAPPIIYEDKDTDDEESEVDAMETDGEEAEEQELGDVTDASEHSDGSEIMSDWLTCTLTEFSNANYPDKVELMKVMMTASSMMMV